jgi:hypothetical protein
VFSWVARIARLDLALHLDCGTHEDARRVRPIRIRLEATSDISRRV